jgi:dynein heavy chain
MDVDDDEDLAENGKDTILAIVSRENERVELIKTVSPSLSRGNVEQWLLELETSMKASVKQVIDTSNNEYLALRSDRRQKWISKWQG